MRRPGITRREVATQAAAEEWRCSEALVEGSVRDVVAAASGRWRSQIGVAASRLAVLRIVFGAIWAIDAYMKWQRSFIDELPSIVSDSATGQPGWLSPWFKFWQPLVRHHAELFGYTAAVVETLLALCLVLGLGRRLAYLLGAAWALGIWAVAEGFGQTLVSGATDIGAASMYVFIFIALYWLEAALAPASAWTLDARIEARKPRWRVIAEPGGDRHRNATRH